MSEQPEGALTLYEMLDAIEPEARAKAGTSMAIIALGNTRTLLMRETLSAALGHIADASAAAATIEDSIFKSRNAAWEEPTEEEERRHRIKYAWRDAISQALLDVEAGLKGEAEKHAPPSRGEATWEEVCALVRAGKPEQAGEQAYMDDSGIIVSE